MSMDDEGSQTLLEPHDGMTSEEKGALLLQYVTAGKTVAGLNFSEADLSGEILRGANLRGVGLDRADLSVAELDGASLDGASLHRADLGGASMAEASFWDANLSGCDLSAASLLRARLMFADCFRAQFIETDLRGADLRGSQLQEAVFESVLFSDANLQQAALQGAWFIDSDLAEANVYGMSVDDATVRNAEWGAEMLRSLRDRGVSFVNLNLLSRDVVEAILPIWKGLTLTFDSRLHRFDPAAFEVFIVQVLGPDTDVTIEEKSSTDEHGHSFFRINGSQADDLVAVAEAFYDKVWESAAPHPSEAAIMQAMSSGFAMILGRLSHQRDHLVSIEESVHILDNPDVQEMLGDRGAAHVLAKDRKALQTRFQRISQGVAMEVQRRTIGQAGDVVQGEVAYAAKEREGND